MHLKNLTAACYSCSTCNPPNQCQVECRTDQFCQSRNTSWRCINGCCKFVLAVRCPVVTVDVAPVIVDSSVRLAIFAVDVPTALALKEMREPKIIDELGEAAEVEESDRCCIEKCEKFGMKYFDEYEKERVARYKSIRATVDKYRKILNVELPAYVTTAEALKSEFPSNSENNKEYLKFWKVQERELDYLRKVLLSTNPSEYLLDGSGDHTVFHSSATNQSESPTNVQDTNNNAVVVNSTFPTTYDKLSSGILPIKWLPAESIRNPKESRNKVYIILFLLL
uniref:Uncharacterized protein n=1 Tax=Heterorhabditis bacteriophora TaxID=37862 RepID=A0A1I7XHJ8_HETBA